jgi:hypothetical protein
MVFYWFIFLLSLRFHPIPFKIQASNPEGLLLAETFLASLTLTKTSKKNPLLEVISLLGPTGPWFYQEAAVSIIFAVIFLF